MDDYSWQWQCHSAKSFQFIQANFSSRGQYFYQKYSGEIWHGSKWSVKGWMHPGVEALHLTLFALFQLGSLNRVTAARAVPPSTALVFSAISCFWLGCQMSWSFQHMAKAGTVQTSVLAPVKGFHSGQKKRPMSLLILSCKKKKYSLSTASPTSLQLLPPLCLGQSSLICFLAHICYLHVIIAWCNPPVLHDLCAQPKTTYIQAVLQWTWEMIHEFFEAEHWGRDSCVADKFFCRWELSTISKSN